MSPLTKLVAVVVATLLISISVLPLGPMIFCVKVMAPEPVSVATIPKSLFPMAVLILSPTAAAEPTAPDTPIITLFPSFVPSTVVTPVLKTNVTDVPEAFVNVNVSLLPGLPVVVIVPVALIKAIRSFA